MTKKKPYLITVSVIDGEHESLQHATYWASTEKEARKWAESQCAKYPDLDSRDSYFAYADELTATKLSGLQEITIQEAKLLSRLSVVFYVNSSTGAKRG
jgi:hypothetical protein